MKKSGLADSPFFHLPPALAQKPGTPPPPMKEAPKEPKGIVKLNRRNRASGAPKGAKPAKSGTIFETAMRDTMIPRYHDTVVPRHHDTTVQKIRSAVKQFGKEAATHRFTPAEKKAVADLIYTYKLRGIRTSENEVARIAIHALIEDYQANGEESTLDKVLKALNE